MSTESNHAVEVSDLLLSLSGNVVLDRVNLSVSEGEIFVLLGPSGCGKTTLLRSIAGLNAPDSGQVKLAGGICFDSASNSFVSPEQRSVGMVFQQGALFPHMTVTENVEFGLKKKDSPRVNELLQLVGMQDLASRYPDSLSGGQAQRVALARALAPEPKLLLLDEPFSALDSQLRLSLRSEVRQILKSAGVTVMLVTHDQDEAFYLGDRIAVMANGSIKQTAEPRVLYESPASPWISEFVGEANLVNGEVLNGTIRTTIGDLELSPHFSHTAGPATVVVRPEQLNLEVGQGYTVVDKQYFGHDVLLTVSSKDQSYLQVRSQTDLFDIEDTVSVTYSGGSVHGWAS